MSAKGISMGYRLDPVEFAKKLLSDNPRHMTDTVLQYLLVEKQQRSVAQGHHFSSTGHAASTTDVYELVAESPGNFAKKFISTYSADKTLELIRELLHESERQGRGVEELSCEASVQTESNFLSPDRSSQTFLLSQSLRTDIQQPTASRNMAVAFDVIHPYAFTATPNGVSQTLTIRRRDVSLKRPHTAAAIRSFRPPLDHGPPLVNRSGPNSTLSSVWHCTYASSQDDRSRADEPTKRMRSNSVSQSIDPTIVSGGIASGSGDGLIPEQLLSQAVPLDFPPTARALTMENLEDARPVPEPRPPLPSVLVQGDSPARARMVPRKNQFPKRLTDVPASRSRTAFGMRPSENRCSSVASATSPTKSNVLNVEEVIYVDTLTGMETNGSNPSTVRMDKRYPKADGQAVYYCSLCPQFSRYRKWLAEMHLARHVSKERYPCIIQGCSFSSRTKQSLGAHIKYHENSGH